MTETILPRGHVLKNYKIEKLLGDGGFGLTYLARDLSLDKIVAIKEYFPKEFAYRGEDMTVYPKSTTNREDYDRGLERFLEEGQTLAKFDDPAIVRVLLFFEENETAYLVMEFVPGLTVAQRLSKKGPFLPEEALEIVKALGKGLAKVHSMDILHRDIKPGNIILRESGAPTLIDFGAAKSFSGDTATMTAIWTPGYGAKEQMSTEEQQGPYTDIYGLAAVAYTMVMGKRPPDAATRWPVDSYEPLGPQAQTHAEEALFPLIDLGIQVDKSDRPPTIDTWFSLASAKTPKTEDAFPQFEEPKTEVARKPVGGAPKAGHAPAPPPAPIAPTQNKRGLIAAGLIGLGAVIVAAAVFFQGGDDTSPVKTASVVSPEPELKDSDTDEGHADAEAPSPPTEETRVNLTANEWIRIELPSEKLKNGRFGITADKPYRIRYDDKVYLINSRSTMARDLGAISTDFIEVKGAQGPVELVVSY